MHTPALCKRLDSITSVRDVEQLHLLEDILNSLDPAEMTSFECKAIFCLFERFPDDDAFGAFFSFLHKIEAARNYVDELIASVQRRPTEFNLEMVARIIRGGSTTHGSIDLIKLIRDAASDPATLSPSRNYAEESLFNLSMAKL